MTCCCCWVLRCLRAAAPDNDQSLSFASRDRGIPQAAQNETEATLTRVHDVHPHCPGPISGESNTLLELVESLPVLLMLELRARPFDWPEIAETVGAYVLAAEDADSLPLLPLGCEEEDEAVVAATAAAFAWELCLALRYSAK